MKHTYFLYYCIITLVELSLALVMPSHIGAMDKGTAFLASTPQQSTHRKAPQSDLLKHVKQLRVQEREEKLKRIRAGEKENDPIQEAYKGNFEGIKAFIGSNRSGMVNNPAGEKSILMAAVEGAFNLNHQIDAYPEIIKTLLEAGAQDDAMWQLLRLKAESDNSEIRSRAENILQSIQGATQSAFMTPLAKPHKPKSLLQAKAQ